MMQERVVSFFSRVGISSFVLSQHSNLPILDAIQLVGNTLVRGRIQVSISSKRGLYILVSEPIAYGKRIFAKLYEQARMGMSQSMNLNAMNTSSFRMSLDDVAHRVLIRR